MNEQEKTLGNSDETSSLPRGAQHTPTPWKARQSFANRWQLEVTPEGFATQTIGAIYAETGSYATCAANAALIVKAVNNHEALRAALKATAEKLERVSASARGDNGHSEHTLNVLAQAAVVLRSST